MRSPLLIAATFGALQKLQLPGTPFACWLHFEESEPVTLFEALHNLVGAGCVRIFVSGDEALQRHESIDDWLIGQNRSDVTTIWQTVPIEEMAWDFLNLELVPTNSDLRVVSAFASDPEVELRRLGEMMWAIGDALNADNR
jgi:hypothetical protein